MSGLIPVDEALSRILDGVKPLETEQVPLHRAANRILSQDLAATRTQPPFPASAMDGYAVRHCDLGNLPCTLRQIGESAAGHSYSGKVAAGECVRIFTGAPVPTGADTIVIQENTQASGNEITVLKAEEFGRYVRPAGMDFHENDVLLTAGHRLNSSTLSLAAAMNQPLVPVYRKPVVAVIATGDELVCPGEIPKPDQIIASNTFGAMQIATESGAETIDLGIAEDTFVSLQDKFEQAADADIIITLGGASVGDHDLVAQALKDHDVGLDFWKIAMRPGKPFMYGVGKPGQKIQRFMGLPGNPVSSLVCSKIFLAPLIKKLTGQDPQSLKTGAKLAIDIGENDRREEYMRATYEIRDGTYYVTPFSSQDSSLLSVLAKATCLMIRPAHAPAEPAGSDCEILLF